MTFIGALTVTIKKSYHPKLFILQAPLTFETDQIKVDVPSGYETDLASIPWFGRWIFTRAHSNAYAAVIHDYLYDAGTMRRDVSDRVFFQALSDPVCNTNLISRWVMWLSVRAGGWYGWHRARAKDSQLKITQALEGPFLLEEPMEIHEKTFFNEIRKRLYKKGLKQSQVEGIKALLNTWHDDYSDYPIEYLAYCLATTYHETGRRMVPVREGFAESDEEAIAKVTRMYNRGRIKHNYATIDTKTGKAYFGRGPIQLTWGYNYRKASKETGIDFYNHPEKALEAEHGAKILFTGCIEGWFTSKKLSDYITDKQTNYRQARRIVNGMDKASMIAGYARKFEHALNEALDPSKVTVKKLRDAGSRTIKAADKQQDIGAAKVVVGVAVGAAKIKDSVSDFEGWAAFGESVKSVVTSFSGLLEWGLSAWPMLLVAGGGLLMWNAWKARQIRVNDELKIRRLANA